MIEWKKSFQCGIAGVYNPITKTVEWKKSLHSGIAGVLKVYTPDMEAAINAGYSFSSYSFYGGE
jgi:hypothetical protein